MVWAVGGAGSTAGPVTSAIESAMEYESNVRARRSSVSTEPSRRGPGTTFDVAPLRRREEKGKARERHGVESRDGPVCTSSLSSMPYLV